MAIRKQLCPGCDKDTYIGVFIDGLDVRAEIKVLDKERKEVIFVPHTCSVTKELEKRGD